MPRRKLNIERMSFSLPSPLCESIRNIAIKQNITTSQVARSLIEMGMRTANAIYEEQNKEVKENEC